MAAIGGPVLIPGCLAVAERESPFGKIAVYAPVLVLDETGEQ